MRPGDQVIIVCTVCAVTRDGYTVRIEATAYEHGVHDETLTTSELNIITSARRQ